MSPAKKIWKIRIVPTDKKKLFRHLLIGLVFATAILLGGLLGTYIAIKQGLPDVGEIEKLTPSLTTAILADDGRTIKEIGPEKRILIAYDKIPETLKQAILATEDPRFFKHKGVDMRGFVRAIWQNIWHVFGGRKLEGGSTITQQLAREFFLYRQQTIHRKLVEWVLAIQIEKRYSKEKIFEMYCNQFNLGHGAYGIEAAAHLFFGKSVTDLTLDESAMIAGIFRGPSRYSPYNAPELTLNRRNHVLTRMVEEGYVAKDLADGTKKKPLSVLPLGRSDSDFGATFFEEVRRYIVSAYGEDALYRGGLKVYTTLSVDAQASAESALDKGLREHDKRRGWRKDKPLLTEDKAFLMSGRTLDDYWLKSWLSPRVEPGDVIEAIVQAVTKTEVRVRVKNYSGRMRNDDIERWTGTKQFDRLLKPGHVVPVLIKSKDETKKELVVSLDQVPLAEAAFLAVEPQTGQIKAMIGGYSFGRSQLNRATQTARQAGSSIKPLLYTAALDNGFTAASRIEDKPTDFQDKWSHETWTPKNYDRQYKGMVTLRWGLEESRNVVTATILDQITPQTGVDYCKKFGISTTLYPYLSLALGTFDMRLIEMVSAYSVFPNRGVRVKPYYITRIEDRDGNILEEAKIESEDVISPQTAYLMTYLLQGVVERGTAASASGLLADKPLAGKTGTTDKYTDAWYIGFSPSLCAGVWVGHDDNQSLGTNETGASAALPIWTEFFRGVIQAEKKRAEAAKADIKPEEFLVPQGIVFEAIDRKTGLRPASFCKWRFMEAFLDGTEPMRYCSLEDHLLVLN
ncbi:MAG: PBP1A family penicillin-binding protein, partial [Candidatus Aminicenantes bacterium]|nr:PBP1A family penicillin-binding protein [Candidatus Aminicenantes bacterium]